MPTALTADQERALGMMRDAPRTRAQVGCTRYAMEKLLADKLIKRAGHAKNSPTSRQAVAYTLTAKGLKRAEKVLL